MGYPSVILTRELFEGINGYDEGFVGWGCDDIDLARRAFLYNKENDDSLETFNNHFLKRTGAGGEIVIYHQFHIPQKWQNKEQYLKNVKRNRDNFVLYTEGKKRYNEIKGLKDLRHDKHE